MMNLRAIWIFVLIPVSVWDMGCSFVDLIPKQPLNLHYFVHIEDPNTGAGNVRLTIDGITKNHITLESAAQVELMNISDFSPINDNGDTLSVESTLDEHRSSDGRLRKESAFLNK